MFGSGFINWCWLVSFLTTHSRPCSCSTTSSPWLLLQPPSSLMPGLRTSLWIPRTFSLHPALHFSLWSQLWRCSMPTLTPHLDGWYWYVLYSLYLTRLTLPYPAPLFLVRYLIPCLCRNPLIVTCVSRNACFNSRVFIYTSHVCRSLILSSLVYFPVAHLPLPWSTSAK